MNEPRSRRKREIFDESARQKIIEAAAGLIGKHGYEGCTISRITQIVGIAYGSFYRYFKSQQDLFEQLLPTLGVRMQQHISAAIHGSPTVLELEKAGFTANYAYLIAHPYMQRLVSEAEQYVPQAYQEYQEKLAVSYARSIKRSLSPAVSARYDLSDLTVLANMLIAARTALLLKYGVVGSKINPLPKNVIRMYFDFIEIGLSSLV